MCGLLCCDRAVVPQIRRNAVRHALPLHVVTRALHFVELATVTQFDALHVTVTPVTDALLLPLRLYQHPAQDVITTRGWEGIVKYTGMSPD